MEIKKILFPTDFSEGALNALPYAVDLAKSYGAKLYMLHVIYDIATASGLYVPHISVDEMYKELDASARKELEKFGVDKRMDIKDVEYTVIRGIPYEEILKFASEKNIDLIVIGTHGRKGLDRVLFGSTAERVVRNASCPVLTVREPKQKG
ncbi:universal stress protein [Dissulfurispira thermophila]|uniref:Universal stress protein n=2 Tax=root TaxID=1 RepID=A0A7G1H0D5_9BACT|nr:universal stress protein [Dissulfurispira thermophila]BCB95506.1 universal stress protein [Dissulfurispira thermophila]